MLRKLFLAVLVPVFFLSSCFGASMDISIYNDGSGKIILEYRVSEMIESLGRLDGNEKWQAIPVGKADFERMASRIQGLNVKSVSSNQKSNDLFTRAELAFDNTDALLAFLNGSGNSASFSADNGLSQFRLVLADAMEKLAGDDILSLLKEITSSYEISVSINAPKEANLELTPGDIPFTQMTAKGKKVSFSIGTGDLLGLKTGLIMDIKW